MKVFRLIREILREIFDEAAYERFCEHLQLSRGRSSYMQFSRETTRTPKVKCC
jgi:hypothetical protein